MSLRGVFRRFDDDRFFIVFFTTTFSLLIFLSLTPQVVTSSRNARRYHHVHSRTKPATGNKLSPPSGNGGRGCEPVQIPMCRTAVPYSRTRMPNLLDHATQRNARLVLDEYQTLVRTRCDPDGVRGDGGGSGDDSLAFYLCAVFAPVCPNGFEEATSGDDLLEATYEAVPAPFASRRRQRVGRNGFPSPLGTGQLIPPCRGVCEKARAACEPAMLRYNVSWPAELDCSRWPTQDRGVCISPETIDWRRRPRANRGGDEADCQCTTNETTQSLRDVYLRSRFDFVIQATFKKAKLQEYANNSGALVSSTSGSSDGSARNSRTTSSTSQLIARMILRHIVKSTSAADDILPSINSTVTVFWTADEGDPALTRSRGRCGTRCQPSSISVPSVWSLSRSNDYLVMGFVDETGRRLQINSRSVVQPWKKNWPVHIQKWERRLQKKGQDGVVAESSQSASSSSRSK